MNSLIRPLDWKMVPEMVGVYAADLGYFEYRVGKGSPGFQCAARFGPAHQTQIAVGRDTIDSAKLAAEQHYRDLVGRCLVPVPDDCVVHRGAVRKIISSNVNTNGPIYGTAMMLGEEVVVLSAESARTKEEA